MEGFPWLGAGKHALLGALKALRTAVSNNIRPPQSIIRVVFHDRRLQYTEYQQLEGWRWSRPGDRILDIGESTQPAPLDASATWAFFVGATWINAHWEAQHGATCMQSPVLEMHRQNDIVVEVVLVKKK